MPHFKILLVLHVGLLGDLMASTLDPTHRECHSIERHCAIGEQLNVGQQLVQEKHPGSPFGFELRTAWSECSGNNGEAMPEQARIAECPSEPQANGLTALSGALLCAL